MARVIPKTKIGLLSKCAAQPRTNATSAEEKRRLNEAWSALNYFVGQHGACVSPPGKMLRIEVMKDLLLPAKLSELGFNVRHVNQNTRITPFGFLPVDVIEIAVDGW